MQDAFWGILIPFLGTSLGAGCVFFLKKSLSDGIQRALTGFAAGVMVAASVWSLLIPAMEQAADLGRLAFFPAAVGFWLGILFLLLLDHLIPHLHQNSLQAEGPKSQLQRTTMPAARIVSTVPMGSTMPDSTPSQNARRFGIPSARRGMEMMAPSGKFWMAIPRESANAPAAVI